MRRSALTLRALCHQDTGAVPAPVPLGSTDEAGAFLAWRQGVLATATGPEEPNPLHTAHGATLGPERVVDVPGHAGSGPATSQAGRCSSTSSARSRPRAHPRPGHRDVVTAVVRAVEEVPRSGPTVYRYLRDDGPPGDEG